jgi:hypothetical protein
MGLSYFLYRVIYFFLGLIFFFFRPFKIIKALKIFKMRPFFKVRPGAVAHLALAQGHPCPNPNPTPKPHPHRETHPTPQPPPRNPKPTPHPPRNPPPATTNQPTTATHPETHASTHPKPTPLPTTGHHKRERRERGSRSVSGYSRQPRRVRIWGDADLCVTRRQRKTKPPDLQRKKAERAETENEEVGDSKETHTCFGKWFTEKFSVNHFPYFRC